MVISISRPDLFTIVDSRTNQQFFGGIQSWYSTMWSRQAGCGPTCAANILSYLALCHTELSPLYGHNKMDVSDFSQFMEEVYQFVTPGRMGVNRIEMFSDGVMEFAKDRGISLNPHVFKVLNTITRSRRDVSSLKEFVKAGLSSDCPLGFLNLSRGKVRNLQSWHWITITKADINQNSIIVTVSDEGRQINLDLHLWYQTSHMSGGLVYFTSS